MAKNIAYTQHGNEITKSGLCSVSGKRYQVTVLAGQFLMWQKGLRIQNAMPYLDKEQRDFIETGFTPEEWRRIFPPEDEARWAQTTG